MKTEAARERAQRITRALLPSYFQARNVIVRYRGFSRECFSSSFLLSQPGKTKIINRGRQSARRRQPEKGSVLRRATPSPTSDALIFISLLTVPHLISSLSRCSPLSRSLVSAGSAELLEDTLTRICGGYSVLTAGTGDNGVAS